MKTKKQTKHIQDFCEDKAHAGDAGFAIAYALLELAEAQKSLATHVKYLGNGDAATPMGAIEAFGAHIGEKLDALVEAIYESNGIAVHHEGNDHVAPRPVMRPKK